MLLSNPYIQPNEDVILWSPSDAGSLRRWFADPEYYGGITDATISRDSRRWRPITGTGAGARVRVRLTR